MVDELLTDVSVSTAIARSASRARSSLRGMVIGLLGMIFGLGLIGYFISSPSISPDDYISKEISIISAHLIKTDDRSRLLLVGSDKVEYFFDHHIYDRHIDADKLQNVILLQKAARIWVDDINAFEIKGILVGDLYIGPEAGAAWDNSNMQSGKNLGWLFFWLGAFCAIVCSLTYWYERARR